jgi:hypothetical protein
MQPSVSGTQPSLLTMTVFGDYLFTSEIVVTESPGASSPLKWAQMLVKAQKLSWGLFPTPGPPNTPCVCVVRDAPLFHPSCSGLFMSLFFGSDT